MAETNQTEFSKEARQAFTFLLLDAGRPMPLFIGRNGQTVACTGELTMFLPPEELVREQSARTIVTQTPHGSWTDSFGNGLPKWSMRGTTGWRARVDGGGVRTLDHRQDGYTAFHVFSDLIRKYLDENQARAIASAKAGVILNPLVQLVFHDHADDEWWAVEPDGMPTKRRSRSRPLMYDYEFRFTGTEQLTVRRGAIDDPIGQNVVGSATRDQKTADAYNGALTTTQEAIDNWELAAKASPTDAKFVDGWTQQVVSRNIADSATDWSPEDIARITSTAGTTPTVFSNAVQSLSTVTTPSLLTRCQQVMKGAKELGTTVTAWRQQATSFIATPFAKAASLMSGVRDVMNSLAFASNFFTLTAQVRSALRLLRTEFRNLWCAGQSLLSFPYNFVQGLKASLQAFLDLFKLSGCATTFSRVKPLSWQGPQFKIPTP
jgi:hypothetical protein